MPKPIKHRELVRRFRQLGWDGPWQRGKDPFLVKDGRRLTIPNPHEGDVDWSLMKRILAQARVSQSQWDSLS
jgi:predicted RNA binding protein YcfA (HicA-like mRNA interferase family)